MLDDTADKETTVRTARHGRKRASAEDVEAEVRKHHPHLRLNHSTYEKKGLPSTWTCLRHNWEFRAAASWLVHPNAVGCPDCREEQARRKRRRERADPDLERHLSTIRISFDEDHATMYRLHCEGAKSEDIGLQLGISSDLVGYWLRKIRSILADVDPEDSRT